MRGARCRVWCAGRGVIASLLVAVASVCTPVAADPPFTTRAEAMKPQGEAAEKALRKFAEEGAPAKRKQLERQIDWVIELMRKEVSVTDAEAEALRKDAEKVVDASLESWKDASAANLRAYLVTYDGDQERAERVASWKPEQVAEAHSIRGWTLPERTEAFEKLVRQHFGEERGKKALEVHAKKRDEISKEMDSFLERWGSTGRVSMDEELRVQIDAMRQDLKLDQKKVDALFASAKALVDAHVAAELVAGRELLNSLVEEQRVKTMGKSSSFSTRFVRPKGIDLEKKWLAMAAGVVGKDAMKNAETAAAERKEKEEKEIVESLKPSEQQARIQMEEMMAREVDTYLIGLSVDDVRKKKLEELSKKAIDASVEEAMKDWIKSVKGWSAAERRSRRNVYFGVSSDDQAPKQKVWTEGIANLFTPEEMKLMKEGVDARRTRLVAAIARAALAEMDKTLALSAGQREALEPLLLPQVEPLLRDENQEYWSYQPYQLFNAAGKVDAKKIEPILDESQRKQWKELAAAQPNYGRSSGAVNVAAESENEEEKPDVETEISRHLYRMAQKERKKHMEVMLAQVGDAKRVLNLPAEKVARLTTAAKGAVEAELDSWRGNVERWVRNSVERATPATVRATLANLERSSYNVRGKGPMNQDVWREAVEALLSESERKEWGKVQQERQRYRSGAMAAMSVNELDRRRRLQPDQFAKMEKLVAGVLDDYLPDIERYMSHSWHLQYYYALLPLAGVKEADMKAVLSERQWKLVHERDLPDAEQYWEGIESYHKQRLEKGDDGAQGGQMIFFDQ